MRKYLLAVVSGLAVILGLAACSGNSANPIVTPSYQPPTTEPTTTAPDPTEPATTDTWDPSDLLGNPDPALAALIDKLYAGVPGLPITENWELTAENAQSFIFIDLPEGAKGVVSQAMINVIPHAMVLLELPDGADVASVVNQIKANADPAKWICVNAEKLGVFSQGNYVVMIMSSTETVDAVEANIPSALS